MPKNFKKKIVKQKKIKKYKTTKFKKMKLLSKKEDNYYKLPFTPANVTPILSTCPLLCKLLLLATFHLIAFSTNSPEFNS